jgi:hypothetical protein
MYKTESNRLGCINRDENAVNNMIKLVINYLETGTRLEKYRRDYKLPYPKATNPCPPSNGSMPAKVQL